MSKFRDTFYNEIKNGLIGTGSDIFGVPDSEELISDYPLNRYYSGILFPSKDFSGKPFADSEHTEEDDDNKSDTDEENEEIENEKEQSGRMFVNY